jgi:hypothetical protein
MSSNATPCPVCGHPLDEPAYDEHGCASFGICPCCGTQFGYDDATLHHANLRTIWIESGARWWSRAQKPPLGWDAYAQMRAAGLIQ